MYLGKKHLWGSKYKLIMEFYAYQNVSVWLWLVIVGSLLKPVLAYVNKPESNKNELLN